MKKSVKAKPRVIVKPIRRKYGYSHDRQERTILTVLQQAELIAVNKLRRKAL
jgi:hypothetical protein